MPAPFVPTQIPGVKTPSTNPFGQLVAPLGDGSKGGTVAPPAQRRAAPRPAPAQVSTTSPVTPPPAEGEQEMTFLDAAEVVRQHLGRNPIGREAINFWRNGILPEKDSGVIETTTPSQAPVAPTQPEIGEVVDQVPSQQEQELNSQMQAIIDLNKQQTRDAEKAIAELDKLTEGLDVMAANRIKNIQDTYAGRIEDMKVINNARLGNLTTQGFRSGTARFASKIQGGFLSSEERAGIGRIASLEREKESLINEARMAVKQEQVKMFYQRYNMIQENRDQQRQAIMDLAKAQKDFDDKIIKMAREERERTEFGFTIAEKANEQINDLAASGIALEDITPSEREGYEASMGLPAGTFEAVYDAAISSAQAADEESLIDAQIKMVNLLSKIPETDTIQIGGSVYHGLKEVDPTKGTWSFKEEDAFGNVTQVVTKINEETGQVEVLSSVPLGRIGKGFKGSGGEGDGAGFGTYFTRPKEDGEIGYFFGSKNNPNTWQELDRSTYLEGVSKAQGIGLDEASLEDFSVQTKDYVQSLKDFGLSKKEAWEELTAEEDAGAIERRAFEEVYGGFMGDNPGFG